MRENSNCVRGILLVPAYSVASANNEESAEPGKVHAAINVTVYEAQTVQFCENVKESEK